MKKKQKSKRYKRYIRKQFRKLEKKAKEYIDLFELKVSYKKGMEEALSMTGIYGGEVNSGRI